MLDNGYSKAEIAEKIGVHRSSIYNELNRNSKPDGTYDPDYAQELCSEKLSKRAPDPILVQNPEMARFIADKILKEHLSPESIEALIADTFPNQTVSRGTIYHAIDDGLIPGVTRESLNSPTTVMFSGGQLRLPGWAMEKTGFSDGDRFEIDTDTKGQITFKKI